MGMNVPHTITTPKVYMTTYNDNHNDYVEPLLQNPLRTFNSYTFFHYFCRYYVSFEDGSANVFSVKTKLPFQLYTLTPPAFLRVLYLSSNRLTSEQTKHYYDHVVHRDRITGPISPLRWHQLFMLPLLSTTTVKQYRRFQWLTMDGWMLSYYCTTFCNHKKLFLLSSQSNLSAHDMQRYSVLCHNFSW